MKDSHWSVQKEKAAGYWQLAFTLILFKLLPVVFLKIIAFPVGFFYFLFSAKAREYSRTYLQRLTLYAGVKKTSSLRHITAFSIAIVEKLEAWGGKAAFKKIHFNTDVNGNIIDDDIAELAQRLEDGKGAMLISSHLGNMEFIRGLAGLNRTGISREVPVNAIVDFRVTAHFNRMLNRLNPNSHMSLINAGDLGPETIVLLQERLAAGELVVIAGDRTSANQDSRLLPLPFLNAEAPFPYGPYFLAAILGVPVYAVFAMRQKDLSISSHYDMRIHKCPVSFDCPRQQRQSRIEELAVWFISLLEKYCKIYPHQWYNFFDFWHP